MYPITPHLWFDTQAKEAAEFYAATFPSSKVTNVTTITDTPSGDCDIVSFKVMDCEFQAISAGPLFKINPSISFMVNFDPAQGAVSREQISQIWEKLAQGGKVLMPLAEYSFSKWYGWVEDRFGVSWQLILTNPAGEPRPAVLPSLLFTGAVAGKAEEATNFYLSVFKDGKRGTIARYPAGMEPDKEGSIMFTDYMIGGRWFVAMDSAQPHKFAFNEAVSFMVHCDSQAEIDYYWEKLTSNGGEESQCGWLTDRYGVSWQIVPSMLDEIMGHDDPEVSARVTQAFLKMKKFDIEALKAVARG